VFGIVIIAHAGLAREYCTAIDHVVGPQEHIAAIGIDPDHDPVQKRAEVCDAAELVDTGNGVVLVADMFGGSPANHALAACRLKNRKIIYGVNLPMLIKLAKTRQMPIDEAIEGALAAGRKYIDGFDMPDASDGA